jgi:hypothetical protein
MFDHLVRKNDTNLFHASEYRRKNILPVNSLDNDGSACIIMCVIMKIAMTLLSSSMIFMTVSLNPQQAVSGHFLRKRLPRKYDYQLCKTRLAWFHLFTGDVAM